MHFIQTFPWEIQKGWVAYIGAATAGFPLGKIIDHLGWEGFFYSMVACSWISVLLLAWSIIFKSTKAEEAL